MSTLEAFRATVEEFLERSGMSATRLGVLTVKDPKFVHDLREGRSPSMATADRVLAFIKEQDAEKAA